MNYTPQQELTHLLTLMRTLDFQIGTLKGVTKGYVKQRVNGVESFLKNAEGSIISGLTEVERARTMEFLDNCGALVWEFHHEFRIAKNPIFLLAMMRSYNAGELLLEDGSPATPENFKRVMEAQAEAIGEEAA